MAIQCGCDVIFPLFSCITLTSFACMFCSACPFAPDARSSGNGRSQKLMPRFDILTERVRSSSMRWARFYTICFYYYLTIWMDPLKSYCGEANGRSTYYWAGLQHACR